MKTPPSVMRISRGMLRRPSVTFRVIAAAALFSVIVFASGGSSEIQASSSPTHESTWRLVETLINPSNAETERTGPQVEGRFEGSHYRYDVSEGSLTYSTRSVDHGFEWWNVNYTATFDSPPATLTPGEKVELHASISASGSVTQGFPGFAFEYRGEGVSERQLDSVTYIAMGFDLAPKETTGSFVVPNGSTRQIKIHAFLWNCAACLVTWVYEADIVEHATPTPTATATPRPTATPRATATPRVTATSLATAVSASPTAASATEGEARPDTPQERTERAILLNINDYRQMRARLEKALESIYTNTDALFRQLRDAEWLAEHGLDDDEKEEAQREAARLRGELSELLKQFDSQVEPFSDLLGEIDSLFVSYSDRQGLQQILGGYKSELDLLSLNMRLRAGDTDGFDRLFSQFRSDPNIASSALIANAFRQLMGGNTRIALQSARNALDRDPNNPTAIQLIRDIEVAYLDRIGARLDSERSEQMRLFTAKLGGHGDAGAINVLLDLATTGVGDSLRAIAGYHELLAEIAGVNAQEAARQVVGIQLVRSLRDRGVTFDEMSALTPAAFKALIERQYSRALTDQQAADLEMRMLDAFRNADVDAIRNGERTQYNVDVGRNYFDDSVLQEDGVDFVAKQFSALDTFLTFAPSAQLGRIASLPAASRLGLVADSTVQQALQKGLRLQQLGQRIYQTKVGAALIDTSFEFTAFQKLMEDSVKNKLTQYIGKEAADVAFAGGSTAIGAAIDQLSAPARQALQEEFLMASDIFLGSEGTAAAQATIQTLGTVFDFIGLNAKTLQEGAYGTDRAANLRPVVQREIEREEQILNDFSVAGAKSRPATFEEFQAEVTAGGAGYVSELRTARGRVNDLGQGLSSRRTTVLKSSAETLDQMETAAEALRGGDVRKARSIYDSLQSGAGAQLDSMFVDRFERLGRLRDQARHLDVLAAGDKTPVRDFITTVSARLIPPPPDSASPTSAALDKALTDAALQGIRR